MGSFELDKEHKKIDCFEVDNEVGKHRAWWECDISKKDIKNIESRKRSCFDVMNDGRKVY